jgi:hypothetical protein
MLQGEMRSIALAFVAAVIITPLLSRLLSRIFPPKISPGGNDNVTRHRLRNQIIEYAGVVFFIAGIALPFLIQDSNRLPSTVGNIALILAFGSLSMVGGIIVLAALFGDRNAESFLTYFERERRISRNGMRVIATGLVVASFIALLAVFFFTP